MTKPVSLLTRQRQSRAQLSRHLTIKQERFVKAYASLGNASLFKLDTASLDHRLGQLDSRASEPGVDEQ